MAKAYIAPSRLHPRKIKINARTSLEPGSINILTITLYFITLKPWVEFIMISVITLKIRNIVKIIRTGISFISSNIFKDIFGISNTFASFL